MLGFAPIVLATARPLLTLGALTAAWLIAYACYQLVPEIVNAAPAVSAAVGGASYYDMPYLGGQVATVVAMSLILGAALAMRFIPPPRALVASFARPYRAEQRPAHSRSDRRLIVGAWLVASLALVPQLGEPALEQVAGGFDSGNFIVWNYFSDQGLVAMKDFWYPYGYQWLYGLAALGPLWAWFAKISMLALLSWSVWRLSDRRAWRVVACLVVFVLLDALGGQFWRYLPGLLVPVTYAALGPARSLRPRRAHVVFFLACLLATLIEADLLLFGLAGCALVLVGEWVLGDIRVKSGTVVRALLIDALPVAGAIGLVLAVWAITDTLHGNTDFFARLTEVSAYGGFDKGAGSMLTGITPQPNAKSLAVMLPFLFLAAGLALGSIGKDARSRGAAQVMFATSGSSLVFVERGLVRYSTLTYLLPLAGLCLVAILLWDRRSLRSVVATSVFACALLAALHFDSGLDGRLTAAAKSPIRAADSLRFLTEPGSISSRTDATYARSRFAAQPDIELARELVSVSGSAHPSFFVLGDAAILYLWFGQRPPYQVNLYNSAPIGEQRRMVDLLRRDRPQYLVLTPEPTGVDGLPHQVRDPLLYSYAIQSYVPVLPAWRDCPPLPQPCKAAEILRRRAPSEPIPIEFWKSQLGDSIDLGYIPSHADPPGRCRGDCTEYAVVEGKAASKGDTIELEASGRGQRFAVVMKTRPRTPGYTIRLDRLWFWPLLGPGAKLTSKTPGWTVETRQGASDDRLY